MSFVLGVQTPFVADITPPSPAPVLAAVTLSGTNAPLSWSASSDAETGVVGYRIYRDGSPLPNLVRGLSTTDNGFLPGTHSWQIAAVDGAGNESAKSNTQSAGLAQAGSNKWNPGHYVLSTSSMTKTRAGWSQSILASIPRPDFLGFEIICYWAVLETSRGVYNFKPIHDLLDVCKTLGLRVVFQVWDTSFGGSQPTDILPAYLATEPGGGGGWIGKGGNGGFVSKRYLPAIMDRLMALDAALGAEFDKEPMFEGYFTAETDTGAAPTAGWPADYSPTAYMDQFKRRLTAIKQAFSHTNVFQSCNFIPTGQALVPDFIDHLIANKICLSSPDVIAKSSVTPIGGDWFMLVKNGYRYNTSTGLWVAGAGPTYSNTEFGIAHDCETPEMGSKAGSFSCAQIYDRSQNVNGDAYILWARKTDIDPDDTAQQLLFDNNIITSGTPPAAGLYVPDVRTFVHAGHPTKQIPPDYYNGNVTTGGTG